LKILYLHQHFGTREGTAGTRSLEFARLLQQRGHQVTILCGWNDRSGLPRVTRSIRQQYEIDGVRILQINTAYSQKMNYLRRMWAFVEFMALGAWAAVQQRQVDVIFATSTPLTIAIPAMLAAGLNHKPFVFEVRDLWPEAPIRLGILRNRVLIALARWLERVTYRQAKHVIALSPGMKDGILQTGIAPDKITVIPNACDNSLFDVPPEAGNAFRNQHPWLNEHRLVIYGGTFGVANGLDYFVRLAHATRRLDPGVVFLLIGDGKEGAALRALAQQLGILDYGLWILPAVPRREMPGVLAAASVATSMFVDNPVTWPNSANKFFDALAAGRPIAINYEGWQADVLRESGAGLALPAGDVMRAAHMLVELLQSDERLQAASAAARRLARERFDRVALSRQLEQVLATAAGEA
jgi:glycosyltransferase involved in cell wall biosynthesis